MTNLLIELMDATSSREIDRIIEQNIDRIESTQRTYLCRAANKAKLRIARINSMKKQSYKTQLN